jgi:hypothetical protein
MESLRLVNSGRLTHNSFGSTARGRSHIVSTFFTLSLESLQYSIVTVPQILPKAYRFDS